MTGENEPESVHSATEDKSQEGLEIKEQGGGEEEQAVDVNTTNLQVKGDTKSSLEGKSTSSIDVLDSIKTPSFVYKLVSVVWRLVHDGMLIVFIVSTVVGVVTNSSKELIRGPSKPLPFIAHSQIRDYYKGNVFQAFKDANSFENSLFMYYAPWDRESQEARSILVKLATFFSQTDILIASVNCWYPNSECAKEYGSKGGSFPVFIFYPGNSKGVQYRGLLRADHLIHFVLNCRYPLINLHSQQHLAKLQALHSSILLGFIPYTTTTELDQNQMSLHTAALALLEHIPDRAIAVAVTTDPKLARGLKLHSSSPIKLLNWNTTHVFPNKTASDGDKLAVWTIKNSLQPAPWLHLSGRKSLVLQRSLGSRSLLVFTPNSALDSLNSVARVVRQVWASYMDCDQERGAHEKYRDILQDQSCSSNRDGCREGPVTGTSCLMKSWSSTSYGEPACSPPSTNLTHDCRSGDDDWYDTDVELLLEEDRTETIMTDRLYDNKDSDVYFGGEFSDEEFNLRDQVKGLGCDSNRSLGMYLVDSSSGGYLSLRDNLGVGERNVPVIVDVEEEGVIVGNDIGPDFRTGLQKFMLNWHRGELQSQPGLRSAERAGAVRVGVDTSSESDTSLQEVTRDTFDNLVIDPVKKGDSVILLYTSSFCSHCHLASHVVHTARRLLDLPRLRFLMVDGARNDLSWQYTALAYPTVIMFPAGRPDLSRLFPTHKQLNTTNLVAFVVSNLPASVRLYLAISSCDSVCLSKVRLSASQTVTRLSRQTRLGRGHRGLARRLKYSKSVLYVVTSWVNSNKKDLPQMTDIFALAILESFLETRREKR